MMGERVKFPTDADSCEGYLALPKSGTGPGVIVIQEWWGLVGHITDVADRFAEAGYVALAPDLYHGAIAKEPDHAMKLLMGLAMDKAALDIAGAATYLKNLPEVQGKGIGAIGFCMGGSLALWSATLSADITSTIAFYPGMPWPRMAPIWANYAGKQASIHCAESDGTSAAPGIQEALTGIRSGGGSVQAFDYPGSKHAFFNNERTEVYNPEAADLAWKRVIEQFETTLK
jgi:carboxymethylenebutenolidase